MYFFHFGFSLMFNSSLEITLTDGIQNVLTLGAKFKDEFEKCLVNAKYTVPAHNSL